jgi:AhpC/TSA family
MPMPIQPNITKIAPGLATAGLLLLLLGGVLLAGCVSPAPLALDLSGKPFDPFAETNHAATVLIFVSDDCPISNRYVPELRRLQDSFAGRGVGFWLVHADPTESAADIGEHDRQFGLTIPALRDPNHQLVKLSQAVVTPTAAVFKSDRTLVYHGRIDDRLADLGAERLEPSHHDLAEALEAVLAGRPVSVPETKAIGCFIPGPR